MRSGLTGLFDPRDYGARDGVRADTAAVQAALDAAFAAGGGRVYLHGGRFLCGALRIRSNTTLHIEAGAILLGSPRIADYPDLASAYPSRSSELYTRRSLIYAEKAENVAIAGSGVIDGQGASPEFLAPERKPEAERPLLLRFSECRNVRLRDVTLRDAAMWVQNYLAGENVVIDGSTVASRANRNNDGIDIDDCTNVRISNCDIWCGDDAVCLKSTSGRGCRNVVVSNCTVSSLCNGLKLGTDSTGGFQDIAFTNCVVYDTGLAAIALECVDGGPLERIVVSNITINRVGGALFLRIGNRGRGMAKPVPGRLRNVTISNIEAMGASDIASSITGQPGSRVEDVVLDNVRIVSAGGGAAAHIHREVPEYPERYPEYNMFVPPDWRRAAWAKRPGQLPAYGLYVRHASGITLRNVDLRAEEVDARPPLFLDDVCDVSLSGFRCATPGALPAAVWMRNVTGARIESAAAPRETRAFLLVEGADSGDIELADNNLNRAATAVEKAAGVRADAVRVRRYSASSPR